MVFGRCDATMMFSDLTGFTDVVQSVSWQGGSGAKMAAMCKVSVAYVVFVAFKAVSLSPCRPAVKS